MISPEATATVNKVMRKIKLYKAKQTSFADMTRKKKDELLTERIERIKHDQLLLREPSTPMSMEMITNQQEMSMPNIVSEVHSTKPKSRDRQNESRNLGSTMKSEGPTDTASQTYGSRLQERDARTRNGVAKASTQADDATKPSDESVSGRSSSLKASLLLEKPTEAKKPSPHISNINLAFNKQEAK